MSARFYGLVLACATWLIACDHPCREGTVLVRFTFDGDLAPAERLDYWLGDESPASVVLSKPLTSGDTLEIALATYNRDADVALQVMVVAGDRSLAGSRRVLRLSSTCTVADFPLALIGEDGFSVAGPAIDRSTVTLTPSTVPANGKDSALLSIVLRDRYGNPIASNTPTVDRIGAAEVSAIAPTDENGMTTASVTSLEIGATTFTAFVDSIALDTVVVNFTVPLVQPDPSKPPIIDPQWISLEIEQHPSFGNRSRCAELAFSLHQATHQPFDVAMFWNDGSGSRILEGELRGASIASRFGSSPFLALPTEETMAMRWDTARALGNASVTLTPIYQGLQGLAVTYEVTIPVSPRFGDFRTGRAPVAIASADFDSDGHADIVTANEISRDLTVLLGDGHALFEPAVRLPQPQPVAGLGVGDFDNDGRPDIAVTYDLDDAVSNNIAILINDGKGRFAPPTFLRAPGRLGPLALTDVNRDGNLDLVATILAMPPRITTLLGNGMGSGTVLQQPIFDGHAPSGLVAAHLDGDLNIDLAIIDVDTSSVHIALGVGDGTYIEDSMISVGPNPRSIAAARIDQDAYVDLVVANTGGTTLTLLRGDGLGGMTSAPLLNTGASPRAVSLRDHDGDGFIDLAYLDDVIPAPPGQEARLSLLRGDGTGGFAPASTIPSGAESAAIVAIDLDGAHALDLVVANNGTSSIEPVRVSDDGTLVASIVPLIDATDGHIGLARDFDNDGNIDLAIASVGSMLTSSSLSIYRSTYLTDGPGTYGDPQVFTFTTTDPPSALESIDFDNDGDQDLVVATVTTSPTLSLYRNDGHGVFAPDLPPVPIDSFASAVVVGNFDEDANLDLAVTEGISNQVDLYRGDGHGMFIKVADLPVGSLPSLLLLADLDGLPPLDLVVGNRLSSDLSVLLGDPLGGFLPERRYSIGLVPSRLLAARLTSDDTVDVAVLSDTLNTVTIMSNDGTGALTASPPTSVAATDGDFVAGDWNSDGLMDLAVSRAGSGEVTLLMALGTGLFSTKALRFGRGDISCLVAAEISGDSNTDIVACMQTQLVPRINMALTGCQ